MTDMTKFLPAIFAMMLLGLSVPGCAQKKEVQPEAVPPKVEQPVPAEVVRVKKVQSEGCRDCHGPAAVQGASDFSAIYDEPRSHHPVGIRYPGTQGKPNFAQPGGRRDDVAFFDRNGNGKADRDEVMLFGAPGEATVECASCHWEHGGAHAMDKDTAKLYLRVENVGSALCTICHQY